MINKPMTDSEWEIHKRNLQEFDSKIVGLESELARQQEARREYINRHNLNKRLDKAYPV
ncbi:hypothetical protein CB293_23230 [Salmonella enterica subsp. enterica serovar Kentucky]|nr:hypothetical protein [Salmonella enterica subsp. enterica serovar Kentucky]